MSELLKIENLCLSFYSAYRPGLETAVLKNINLRLSRGTTHALVGESGSGKSVTALSILRLIEEFSYVKTSGKILFDNQDILTLTKDGVRSLRGNRIAMIFQEPMTSLNPVYTVGNQLMESLVLHQKMSRREARMRGIQLLERTGISEAEYRCDSYPHQLSGGQRQRVMIAIALACRPDLLIADEPTTALDVTIENQILQLIKDLQQEFNMALLLITHDLPLVRRIADNVSIMQNGCIVEQGTTDTVLRKPAVDYTKRLLASIPDKIMRPRPSGPQLISLENIHCSFSLKSGWQKPFARRKKTIKALDGITLTVRQGNTLGVVGESGSGKSTLGLCLLQLIRYEGKIFYYRPHETPLLLSELSSRTMLPLRRELQIVFQDPFSSLSPRLSIEEIVGEGLKAHKLATKAKRRGMVEQALAEVELEPSMCNRYPHEFSGGQRQRIAIARAIILKPKLLILDEPTSALDVTVQAQIINLLKKLQQRLGMTYIFITHDLRVIRSLADELAVMQHGKIVENGTAKTIFANPKHSYTKKLFNAACYNS